MLYCVQIMMKIKYFAFSIAISAIFMMPQSGLASTFSALPLAMQPLYMNSESGLFWADNGQLKRNARQIPDVLENAEKHGINPNRYGYEQITAMLDAGVLDSDEKSKLDML